MDRYNKILEPICFFVAILILFFPLNICANKSVKQLYKQYDRLSISELFEKGQAYYSEGKKDSALIFFSLCEDRDVESVSQKERSLYIRALVQSTQLYFLFYDYEKASNRLLKALKLCQQYDINEEAPKIYVEQGALLMTYATQKRDDRYFEQAEEAYRKAFWEARRYSQWHTMITAFINLGNRMFSSNRIDSIQQEIEAFKGCIEARHEYNYNYAYYLQEGLLYMEKQDYERARESFRKQMHSLSPDDKYSYLLYGSYASMVKSFVYEERYDSAIVYELQMLDLATRTNMKDGQTVALYDLSEMYRLNGDSLRAAEYYDQALRYKDSLLNKNKLDEVGVMQFVQQLEANKSELHGYKRYNLYISCLLFLVVGVGVVWFVVGKRRVAKEPAATPTEKYMKSTLDDETKESLKKKIQEVFEHNREIFTPNFNLDRLSELCESKPKYVSQVINQLYETNFSSLLNLYRIKEACRIINDKDKVGNYTLEAIAGLVGFKSRATFHTTFKRVMGQTPGEYIKSVHKKMS